MKSSAGSKSGKEEGEVERLVRKKLEREAVLGKVWNVMKFFK